MQTIEQLRSGNLRHAKSIKLSCGLTEVPDEIFSLSDTLEILDLSGNHLSALPDAFTKLKKLKILFLSDNQFTEFPSVLGQCESLDIIGFKANKIERIAEDAIPHGIRWLILTNNAITQLPKSIGKCVNLQKFMLAGNQLKDLPSEMAFCRKLELLRIPANNFETLPSWLFSLPRLSWLAFAGNPMDKAIRIQQHLPDIPWTELKIEHVLGEGASGVISKARWKKESIEEDVAVKIFKGEVTSDGLPGDEMKACIAAGLHQNLAQVLGKIAVHPQQKQGLVFSLIDSSYKNLGGPPNFITCTRDTFKSNTQFSINDVIQIALGIAAVTMHLHQRGIMHGDLYAHNILINENANPLLSDFGAAVMYDGSDDQQAFAVERLEVRAFGCLLDDLLFHISIGEKNLPSATELITLRDECMHESVGSRPDFESIHARIKIIADSLHNVNRQ